MWRRYFPPMMCRGSYWYQPEKCEISLEKQECVCSSAYSMCKSLPVWIKQFKDDIFDIWSILLSPLKTVIIQLYMTIPNRCMTLKIKHALNNLYFHWLLFGKFLNAKWCGQSYVNTLKKSIPWWFPAFTRILNNMLVYAAWQRNVVSAFNRWCNV